MAARRPQRRRISARSEGGVKKAGRTGQGGPDRPSSRAASGLEHRRTLLPVLTEIVRWGLTGVHEEILAGEMPPREGSKDPR